MHNSELENLYLELEKTSDAKVFYFTKILFKG